MQANKRIRHWVVQWALAGAVFALVFQVWPRPRNLLERATRIVDTSTWDTQSHSYYWLSDHQLLFFRPLTPSRPWLPRTLKAPVQVTLTDGTRELLRYHTLSSNVPSALFVYDLSTHSETPLTALTRLYNRTAGAVTLTQVSPDGQWLLWRDWDTEVACAARLDGLRYLLWKVHPANLYWCSDSRHWIEVLRTPCTWVPDKRHPGASLCQSQPAQLLRHSVDVPAETTSLPPPNLTLTGQGCEMAVWNGEFWEEKGCYARDRISQLTLVQSGSESVTPQRSLVRFPASSQLVDMSFSAQSHRAVWQLEGSGVPPVSAFLHRLLPFYQATPEQTTSLWVSNQDGGQMQEVGFLNHRLVEGQRAGTGLYRETIRSLCWLPGGRQLSFLYQNALWTIPAD